MMLNIPPYFRIVAQSEPEPLDREITLAQGLPFQYLDV